MTETGQTEEFTFQSVAYRPTVYKTGTSMVKGKLMSKFNILIWLNIAHAKCWHDHFFGSFIQVSKIDKGLRLERNLSRLKLLSHITLVAIHKLCRLGRGERGQKLTDFT